MTASIPQLVAVTATLVIAGPVFAQQRLYLGGGYPGVYAGAGVPPAGFGYLSTNGYFGPPPGASPGVRNIGPNAFGPPGGYYGTFGYVPSPAFGVAPSVGVAPVAAYPPRTTASVPPNTAATDILAPAGATVTLNGTPASTATGVRRFVSPPLEPGKAYFYKAVATWTENGRPVTREKTVDIMAGGRFTVDLTAP